jgi:DNA invertase Pin-like site-specific DNA recombinase
MNTTTTEPINLANTSNATNTLPEFGRWQDVQRLFGIKRGTLYNLINEGKVKSVLLRRKGNIHGCRLIHLASLSQYLNGLLETQQSL